MNDDDLRILVIEALHADADGYRRVVRDIARDHGDIMARRLETALVSAAREIDAAIRNCGSPTDEARTARRLALLLGMDIDRLAGASPSTGGITLSDLAAFWASHDDFFLRL